MLRCRNGIVLRNRQLRPSSYSAVSPAASAYLKLRESVRASDVEGYFCGSLMPSASRDSFFTMRALNVELAGVRDAARGNAATASLRFGFWRALVADAFATGGGGGGSGGGPLRPADHPLFVPLSASVARHRHTRRWLERLIDAREGDAEGRPPATVADLEAYAEATHGSLLYLALEAAGVRDVHADHAASHIGKALGLAMVLRALPVHARLGQRYLPDELLKKHGLAERDVLAAPEEVFTVEGTPLFEGSAAGAGARAPAAPPPPPSPPPPPPARQPGAGAGGVRLAKSRAQEALDAAGGAAPRQPGGPAQPPGGGGTGGGAGGEAGAPPGAAAATAALRSGLGAASLVLVKPPPVRAALAEATLDLASRARAHLVHARDMAPRLPAAAAAALLPAVPTAAFLERLEAQGFDVFAGGGGLGPWKDGRPHARLLLQAALLKHTLLNTY